MAQVAQAPQTASAEPGTARVQRAEVTGWVGFIAFAGMILILAGIMQGLYGLVAIVNDKWVVFGNQGNLLLDLTAWGWIHLALGVVLVLVGIGVLLGNMVARVLGIIAAGLSMIANFMFLPAYPLWGLVIIALDALVIFALIAHGREINLR
jgi:hypothetical protein